MVDELLVCPWVFLYDTMFLVLGGVVSILLMGRIVD